MIKISIIMPAYNAARSIENAIRSVVRQTFPGWELIIIDDGSSDNTVEIVRQMSVRDNRIVLYENRNNLGVSVTRNRGLDVATGNYIAFLDSDDIWQKDKLKRQLTLLQQTNADLCYTAYEVMRKNGTLTALYQVPKSIHYIELLKENVIGCSTVLLKRSCLGSYRFETAFFHEDYALWLQLLKCGCIAVGINEPLVYYRKGGRSKNKLFAAKNRWLVMRRQEKLALPLTMFCFICYIHNGIRKTICFQKNARGVKCI